MRVGVFIPQFSPESGGAFSFQESLIDSLNKLHSSHEFFVFYHGKSFHFEDSLIHYIPISYKPKLSFKNKIRLKIKKILFRVGFKSVKLPLYFSDALEENNIELIWFMTPAFEEVNIPYIYTVWDLQHRLQPFFPEVSVTGWKWEDREKNYLKTLPRAAYIFTGAEAGKKEIIQFYGIDIERVKVLPLPTPSFCFDERYNIESNELTNPIDCINEQYLFYPAQFWPHKNHVGLLYTLKILKEEYNFKFKLLFTGSDKGNLNFIKIKIYELGLSNDVIIRGFVSFEELVSFYKSAFAMVFPSFFGPDNLPPLEAFAFGCPVIAANVPGAIEQLGDAALLVDAKNEEAFALAIKSLYDKPLLRENLINKGKIRAASWTADDYVNKVIETIDAFEKYRRCWSSTEKYIHL